MGGVVEGQTEASAQCNLEVWWGEAVLQYGVWCGEDRVSCCCLEEGGLFSHYGFLRTWPLTSKRSLTYKVTVTHSNCNR
eukprot:7517820-Ditylum_brightwellii.AAC.2